MTGGLFDGFLEPQVGEYDPSKDPLARPLEAEQAEAPVHSEQCAKRWLVLRTELAALRRDVRNMRVSTIQVVVIAALVLKGSDFITNFILPHVVN